MRKCLLVLFNFIVMQNLYSQDSLILINGDVLPVKVLDIYIDEVGYKSFDNLDGPTIHISKSDIALIKYKNGKIDKFEESDNDFIDSDTTKYLINLSKSKGFYRIIELNTAIWKDYSSIGLQFIIGYKINSTFGLGLGLCYDYYKYSRLLPIFADFRINLIKGHISPFILTDIGYSVKISNIWGGFYINPLFGLKIGLKNRNAFYIGTGLRYQNLQSKELSSVDAIAINFKLGILF